MSRASRNLQVGDRVTTDFNRAWSEHVITQRVDLPGSTSGIGFYVTPLVPGSTGGPMCSDWFEPVAVKEGSESNG